MKIAICDDDKNELFRILSVLADYQTQRNIEFSYKPFDNSTELASNLLQEHYDIYLLDVVMPEHCPQHSNPTPLHRRWFWHHP